MAAARVARLEKKAHSGSLSSQLLAAIRMTGDDCGVVKGKERVRELLQSGANANTWEPAPWWIIAGTAVMPCILCCAFGAPQHYSKQALHVAMMQGDTEVVKLLLDSGADPKAPAVFWNCCVCCSWTAHSAGFRAALMGNPDSGSANGENSDPVSWAGQEEIWRLLQGEGTGLAMAAAMTPMMVACPPGAAPGSTIVVTTPSGQQMQVQVPAGVVEGVQFQVMVRE
jgi:hypothetical protein